MRTVACGKQASGPEGTVAGSEEDLHTVGVEVGDDEVEAVVIIQIVGRNLGRLAPCAEGSGGRERAAAAIESAFAHLAQQAVAAGVRRLVVAGGETAGAVVQAFGIESLAIGPAIDPGVPWTAAQRTPPLALALKSGNFGSVDFFAKALAATDAV